MAVADPLPIAPAVQPVGDNSIRLWGITMRERLRRLARAQKLGLEPASDGPTILADTRFVFDPAWLRELVRRPGLVLLAEGRPVLSHVRDAAEHDAVYAAMTANAPLPAGLTKVVYEEGPALADKDLRKRETPFVMTLRQDTVRAAERASYRGAYKGVTDLLTKYLWPEAAFWLTKLAARLGITPNQVTALGTVLCILATVLFWHGHFWSGLAAGLVFMVLDTVDGKLARCTVTSSPIGNIWDHGVDLVHPPFWWWAWATGCAAYGRPLSDAAFWWVMATIIGGYVVQRAIEGAFMRLYGMHIHIWRRFDSWFRLITARRNPNMVILFVALLLRRPDLGIIAVAAWTVMSLIVHAVQLAQAFAQSARGKPVASWLN